jgi:hypothetical protein
MDNQTEDIKIEDDVPEKEIEETKVEQTPEEGIAELKSRLELERAARAEAEKRAALAVQSANQAQNRVQDGNLHLINSAIDKLKRESDFMKVAMRDSLAGADYDKAADIQEAMSINAAKLLQLQNGKSALEEKLTQAKAQASAPPTNPVEAVASTLSPRSAAWVRAHPQYITDQRMYQQMIGAHNEAVRRGVPLDSDEYFEAVEKHLGLRSVQNKDDGGEDVVLSAASAPAKPKAAPSAAPSSRTASNSGGRAQVVRLTPEMKEMASIFGMTPEEYAKNMMDLKKSGKIN